MKKSILLTTSIFYQVTKINAKIVICDMETAKYAEHAVASMKTNSNKMIHLLSVEKGAGINCILDDFEIDDHSVEPIVVDDIEKDVCLIFWKAASNGFLSKMNI